MENDSLWNKIVAGFFRKTETPESDIFVQRVMARVHELEKTETSWGRWLVPSFSFGFAALIFALTFSSVRPELSAETLLTADREPEAEWVLGYTLEELR